MSPVTRSGLIQLYVLGDEVTNKPIADNLTFASYGNDKSAFSEKKLSYFMGKGSRRYKHAVFWKAVTRLEFDMLFAI